MKILRIKKGLTQLQLSVEAGLSTAMVCEIESGKKNPSVDTIDKIAEALDVPSWHLLYDVMSGELKPPYHSKEASIIVARDLLNYVLSQENNDDIGIEDEE